jgi:hypothetical protein
MPSSEFVSLWTVTYTFYAQAIITKEIENGHVMLSFLHMIPRKCTSSWVINTFRIDLDNTSYMFNIRSEYFNIRSDYIANIEPDFFNIRSDYIANIRSDFMFNAMSIFVQHQVRQHVYSTPGQKTGNGGQTTYYKLSLIKLLTSGQTTSLTSCQTTVQVYHLARQYVLTSGQFFQHKVIRSDFMFQHQVKLQVQHQVRRHV